MSFPYKHVLMIGATSGIGKAMADQLIQAGFKVTAVGRRQDRLDDFVNKHGEHKARSVSFDIGKISAIPQFAAEVTRTSPDIDCLFLNAGTQKVHDFSNPDTVDLSDFSSEMNINFMSFVGIVHAFLPFLLKKQSATGIVFTGSHVAVVPAFPMPAYSASKAALNSFTLCLREQLKDSHVTIIEISPPVVQTELHDYMGESVGRKMGIPVSEFTEKAFEGLMSGSDQIVIGIVPSTDFQEIVDKRRAAFDNFTKRIRGTY